MNFLKKSIAKKTFVALFSAFIVLAVVEYLFIPLDKKYSVAALAVFFVFSYIFILMHEYLPLSKIFHEMKVFLAGRLYKKIFTDRIDEVGVFAHFFNDITRHVEKIKYAIAEGKRMSEELSVGSDIQRKILPKEMPVIEGLSIFGNTRPASEVGGDSFDIIQTSSNTLVYVGDVTGHGVPAALIMIMVNTLIRTYSEIYSSGYDIITNTNRILKQRIEPRRFMTCVLLRWNNQENRLYYTGAGHEHILIFRKREDVCEVKQTGGIALGMVPDISKIVKEESIDLESGDYIVLYSDGIVEAKNIEGEMFGVKRLKESVEKHAASSTPEELFTHISKEFGFFVGDQIQEDDITLITIKKK